jgi:hypothetical protein
VKKRTTLSAHSTILNQHLPELPVPASEHVVMHPGTLRHDHEIRRKLSWFNRIAKHSNNLSRPLLPSAYSKAGWHSLCVTKAPRISCSSIQPIL